MTFSIAVNRDELDCLRTDVETLEVCSELTASGSHNKARVAILILDHFADILLFRESKKILESDRFRRWVLKPEFTPSEGEKTLYNFSKKLNLVAEKSQGVAKVDQAVLLIAHSYRNAIYHRDIHNERLTFPQFRGHRVKPQPSSLHTRPGSDRQGSRVGAADERTPRYIRRCPASRLHGSRRADGRCVHA